SGNGIFCCGLCGMSSSGDRCGFWFLRTHDECRKGGWLTKWIHDQDASELASFLKVLGEQDRAPRTLSRCDNQAVPIRNLGRISPVPSVFQQTDAPAYRIPSGQLLHVLSGLNPRQSALAFGIGQELVDHLPTDATVARFPQSSHMKACPL